MTALKSTLPAGRLLGLLILIVLSLLALLVVPFVLTERNEAIRAKLIQVATPLQGLVSSLERVISAEVAAIRGYAVTSDAFFRQRYLQAHAQAERDTTAIRRLLPRLGQEERQAGAALLQAWADWSVLSLDLVQGRISPGEFRDRLPGQQRRYEQILQAEQRFDELLLRLIEGRRQQIQRAEDLRNVATLVLVGLTLAAVVAVVWLARRLYVTDRERLLRAQREAELGGIARMLNEATDLPSALQRIVVSVAGAVRADSAHLEQVNYDQDEIEIVSVTGDRAPLLGARAPYPGSLAEQVITSGRLEWTTAEDMVRENRPMAPFIADACPGCKLLVVPLVSEGAALGALMLHRAPAAAHFDEEEAARIRAMADMAALALRRMYLFEEARRRERELELAAGQLQALNQTLEERVRVRTEELSERNQDLQMFASAASHDLQEPLRKVTTFVDLLREALREPTPEALRYMDRIDAAVKRMAQFITDLLALSRVATRDETFERVDLNGILGGVLSDLEVRVKETGGRVEVHELCTVEADPTQMRQLFQNLIGNALKFRRPDVPPVVRLTCESVEAGEAGSRWRITVQDNGIGFEEAYLDRIFQPFQRLHGSSEFQGSGMGLAIVKRIVERHGGTVTARSAPGSGSTFVIELPAAAAQEGRFAHEGQPAPKRYARR